VKEFIARHRDKIVGVLSCFDRLIFRGHLSEVAFPGGVEQFLRRHGLLFKDFKPFVLRQAERIKARALALARERKRPYLYLERRGRKEKLAREIARRDGITQGLIAVFATVEPCQTFRLVPGPERPRLAFARRKCLFLYYYFIDPQFGFMHVRIQTWFPFQIQVYLNGHDWLARKLDRHRIGYRKEENAFRWIADFARAQGMADQMVHQNWRRVLHALAHRVNPLLQDLFPGEPYYWVTDQSEYATDVVFRDPAALQTLYPKLIRHALLSLSAEDVLTFLGKKGLHASFTGEVCTELKGRLPGARVKHRVKENWIKMYDKHGYILRIETVINRPYEFKVRRRGLRHGEPILGWFPMCKRVTNLYRYREVSCTANFRYLQALSVVDDPAAAYRSLHRTCEPVQVHGRPERGLNPLANQDLRLFAAVLRGEHAIQGFRNRDVRAQLHPPTSDPQDFRKQSARVSRLFRRLHAHGLIAKIPRTRRWRSTATGSAVMSTAIRLHDEYFPEHHLRRAS
jgi:hypothetical protein